MPSGLAEQSPIYKHKVSDTLAAASDDSLKFAAIETKTDFPDCFPVRGNLELLDVDLVVGRGRDASSPLLHLATRFCDERGARVPKPDAHEQRRAARGRPLQRPFKTFLKIFAVFRELRP